MCPHGDPFCPCPDGDACHYEGDRASPDPAARPMACPLYRVITNTDTGEQFQLAPGRGLNAMRPVGHPHCHVEGCQWPEIAPDPSGCGLARLRPAPTLADLHRLGCGCYRSVVAQVVNVAGQSSA